MSESSGNNYEIEKIVSKKKIDNKYIFLIKWVGYSSKDNTWEPYENIKNYNEMIKKFEKNWKLKKKKRNKFLKKRKLKIIQQWENLDFSTLFSTHLSFVQSHKNEKNKNLSNFENSRITNFILDKVNRNDNEEILDKEKIKQIFKENNRKNILENHKNILEKNDENILNNLDEKKKYLTSKKNTKMLNKINNKIFFEKISEKNITKIKECKEFDRIKNPIIINHILYKNQLLFNIIENHSFKNDFNFFSKEICKIKIPYQLLDYYEEKILLKF